MVRIEPADHRGVEGLAVEDDRIRFVILPSMGGKITSLVLKATGREFMWQDPPGAPRIPPYGALLPEYDVGGFQECFPTIGEVFYPEFPWRGIVVPDHGEVWALPWDWEEVEDGLHLWVYSVRFAYRMDKWLKLLGDGGLEVRYEVGSLAPFDFKCLWSSHPLLDLRPGMRMLLPEGTRVRTFMSKDGRLGEMGAINDWPIARQQDGQEVDLSLIHSVEAGTLDKLFTVGLTQGWCAVHDPETTEYLSYSFSLDEIPYVGVLIIEGSLEHEGEPYLLCGLEPCNGYPDGLDAAMAWGDCSTLPGRGRLSWSMEMRLGQGLSQEDLVHMLSAK